MIIMVIYSGILSWKNEVQRAGNFRFWHKAAIDTYFRP